MFGIAFIVIANRIDNQSIKGVYELGSIWVYSSLHIKPGNARGIFLSTIWNYNSRYLRVIVFFVTNRIILYCGHHYLNMQNCESRLEIQ